MPTNLVNNIPYPSGLNLTKEQLNGAGEHLYALPTSTEGELKQLFQSDNSLKLTESYNFGNFWDTNFNIQKWLDFLHSN